MPSPLLGKTCSKCKRTKSVDAFYSKGDRVDSKCKECAKKLRNQRYQRKKVKEQRRTDKGRLMRINNVNFIERFERSEQKRKALCQTVHNILEDHLYMVVTGQYSSGVKNAA